MFTNDCHAPVHNYVDGVCTKNAEHLQTVATPIFNLAAGTYTGTQSVTLSCETTGATIRYTTNGTEPTVSSPAYSTAISVPSTMTIKAKAFKDGMTASETASATYTIAQSETEYTISVLPSENGSVTADKTTAQQGDTVTLTVTPNEDYQLKKIRILDGLGQDLCVETGLAVTNNAFEMPDMNVNI